MLLPGNLDWLRTTNPGRRWLERLPDLLAECAEEWNLDVGDPYDDSFVSLALPAVDGRGRDLVLKIQLPHRESEHEARALQDWNGNGAIQLIDHDGDRNALLLERCTPGTHLSQIDAEGGITVMIDLLPRLWVPVAEPYGSLSEEVERWVGSLPLEYDQAGEPFDKALLNEALDILPSLAAGQGEQVLLHQDLHGDNVLRAQREPWLAIDPKPLRGEREFGLSSIIRSYEFGHSADAVTYRLDRLVGELGLDRERSRLWAFGQAIAWGFEGGEVLPRHLETARWLLDA